MHGKTGSKSNRDLIDSASALEGLVSQFDPSLRAGLLLPQQAQVRGHPKTADRLPERMAASNSRAEVRG
jgi:hypothetical protein